MDKPIIQEWAEMERQIEAMKCCGNCEHLVYRYGAIPTCRSRKEEISCPEKCDKWELAGWREKCK
jgi:hypothetical protein